MHVAGAQLAALQVAELIEHEQRVVAGAVEVAVPGGALLRAMGRAHRAVHVERDPTQRLGGVVAVDPVARHVRQGGEVLGSGEHFGLEPPHLAGRCRIARDSLAADDPAHRGITSQSVGVVDVLVAGEPAEDRLARKGDDAVQSVVAVARVDDMLAHQLVKTQHVIQLAVEQQTAIGADRRAVELDTNATIEIEPSALRFAFTRKVRHRRPPPMPSMQWNICDLRHQA